MPCVATRPRAPCLLHTAKQHVYLWTGHIFDTARTVHRWVICSSMRVLCLASALRYGFSARHSCRGMVRQNLRNDKVCHTQLHGHFAYSSHHTGAATPPRGMSKADHPEVHAGSGLLNQKREHASRLLNNGFASSNPSSWIDSRLATILPPLRLARVDWCMTRGHTKSLPIDKTCNLNLPFCFHLWASAIKDGK
jgi:hypothetical protein